MSDVDLDELSAELEEFAPPEKSAGRPPREERIVAGFEDFRALSRNTAALPSMARTGTFSSGSMPCVSTACASLPSAARCSNRSTIRGC